MVDIRELSEDDRLRAFWLWIDSVDIGADIPKIQELMDVWARSDESGKVAGSAFFLSAAFAWPAVLELCERNGISRQWVIEEVGAAVKRHVAEYLRAEGVGRGGDQWPSNWQKRM